MNSPQLHIDNLTTSRHHLPRPWPGPFGQGGADAFAMRWSALHSAARTVAGIAGIAPPVMTAHLKQVPALVRDLHGRRREEVEQGLSDLCAVMEPGLAALLAAVARGAHPASAARRLWQEFCLARDALAALTPRSPLR